MLTNALFPFFTFIVKGSRHFYHAALLPKFSSV